MNRKEASGPEGDRFEVNVAARLKALRSVAKRRNPVALGRKRLRVLYTSE